MSEQAPPQRAFRRRGLGRGLDALLTAEAEPAAAPASETAVLLLDPASVRPNPEQPRRDFDEQELATLGDSIRDLGLLHPIVVQPDGGGYQLVAGERRLRAAHLAGVRAIPALVRPPAESPRESLELALIENLLRTDLNPIEEASAYARLADTFGMSHDAIAARLGRSRPTVSNAIRLLALPPPVLEAVAAGRLSAGHARALLALPNPSLQAVIAQRAEGEQHSVRQTESLVSELVRAAGQGGGAGAQQARRPLDPDDRALQRGFEQATGLPVRLQRNRRGGGRLTIEFSNDDDLDALYRTLSGPPL